MTGPSGPQSGVTTPVPSPRLAVGLDVSAVPAEPRGAGRYVIELARALHARGGLELRLQARRSDARRWEALAPGAEVKPVVPDSRARRLVWEQLASPRFVDRWGVAVHHGPHYTMPEVAKLPKVVTVHDLTFFDHPEWHEKVKVAVFKRAIRAAAELAAAIVCVSGPTARRLEELVHPQCPVHVIPHGVDHGLFRPECDGDADAARVAVLGLRRPYVAFVGTLEPRKDLATLVRAFDAVAADHPELQLAVVGGKGWGNEPFERAVAASPNASRIVRTGFVPDVALPPLLRQAAAVVYPSLEEGFGLPVLEALACGAPTVTTRGSVMEDLAGGAAVATTAGDPDGLAAALDRLLQGDGGSGDGARRRRLGLEVAGRYTWDATAAAHEAVYREVAGAKPAPR
ncbi:MAG: glycosyltransferase family 4 protein [Actinobacteria bacterium]|nr:glycosyltransferase family 4 protein [Actinomycetota bacterium]